MYFDFEPCRVCGSTVDVTAERTGPHVDLDEPVGPGAGYVGTGDPTVDKRICSNPDCPTNQQGADLEP